MRIWHRFKLLAPLLLAITVAADGRAQDMSGYGSYGAPAFMPGAPPYGSPAYGATAYQGMPQSFHPSPNISPYDHAFEQHYTSDGLWYKRAISGMGKTNNYFFNIESIQTRSRKLRGTIGDGSAPTFDQDQVLITPANFPDALFLPSFPHYGAGVTGTNKNQGIKLSGGSRNQIGWGFSWNASYNGESTDVFNSRAILESQRLHFFDALVLEASGGVANGALPSNLRHLNERAILERDILGVRTFDAADAETFGVLGSTFEILDRNLYPHGSIGLQTGEDVDGVSQLFDMDYIAQHSLTSYGGGFHFSFMPMYEDGDKKVRAIIGARVFRLQEGFHFFGADSGLGYGFSLPNGLDDDDDFVIDNVDENGNLNFVDPVTDDTQEIMIRSFVNNVVRSTMSGPEIGVEYEVAKRKSVRFYGATRVGALVNVEKMSLEGDNIGDTTAIEVDPDTGLFVRSQMFDTSTNNGQRTQNFFTDSNSTTHISPMFEQTLSAELPLFDRVPILQDIWQLQNAKLRLGWTYTWIGEVADPNQSIVWRSNPRDGVFPSLSTNRSSFFQNQFSAGINWEF
ncbi:MAG: hypothetical protein R3C59_01905 [Planctomycetaceae bacterium]